MGEKRITNRILGTFFVRSKMTNDQFRLHLFDNREKTAHTQHTTFSNHMFL